MGKLGWSERDYFTASPESVHLAVEGYAEGREEKETLMRFQTEIIFKVMGGKQNIRSIWPIGKPEPAPEPIRMTAERYKAFTTLHNVKTK